MSPVSSALAVPPVGLQIASLSGTYSLLGEGPGTPSANLAVGSLRLAPMYTPRPLVLAGIGVNITVAGEAGSHFRPAIYRDSGDIYPGALVLDPGTVPADVVAMPELILPAAPNLLTPNSASIETDASGWSSVNQAPTIARSTAQSLDGLASLQVTATSGSAHLSTRSNPYQTVPVTVGATYTAAFWARGTGSASALKPTIYWYTAAGGFVSAAGGTTAVAPNGSWAAYSVTATAPATAAFGTVAIETSGTLPTIGDVWFIDKAGFFTGAQPAGAWSLLGSGALDPGVYWLGGVVQDVVTTQPTITTVAEFPFSPVAGPPAPMSSVCFGVQTNPVPAALPAVFSTAIALAGVMPRMFVRAA
jgi:hypothetical protein